MSHTEVNGILLCYYNTPRGVHSMVHTGYYLKYNVRIYSAES